MFKKIKTEDSVGEKLLHDITGILEDGFKGVVFKRGHIVREADIERLKDIGKDHIYVGELDSGYVHEEDAALALAKEVVGENISFTEPSEGKTNLEAEEDGVFSINIPALNRINSVGDYTLACKRNFTPVKKGDRLVGLRIVPLFTEEEIVEEAVEIARDSKPVFQVYPYQKKKIGIIITGSEVYYGRIKDLFEPVLRKKFSQFPAEIIAVNKAPDDLEYIEKILESYLEEGVDIVIFTGGMSVDPDDLTPSAIRNSGAQMIIQGLPVQPGNMLTIGKLENTYLIGVPGASIHSEITSFDLVLPRLFTDMEIKREDLLAMGEGGLL